MTRANDIFIYAVNANMHSLIRPISKTEENVVGHLKSAPVRVSSKNDALFSNVVPLDAYTVAYERLCKLQEIVPVLHNVIIWQKKRLDYQAVYSAYLIEAIDEDEFSKESEQFISDLKVLPPEKILEEINLLRKASVVEMDISDYADYLSVDAEDVKKALEGDGLLNDYLRLGEFHLKPQTPLAE